MKTPYLVGITGGSGSGKTYFLKRLMEKLGTNNVTLVSQDNYYLPKEQQAIDENGVTNFDTPASIDNEWFYKSTIYQQILYEKIQTFHSLLPLPQGTLTFNFLHHHISLFRILGHSEIHIHSNTQSPFGYQNSTSPPWHIKLAML